MCVLGPPWGEEGRGWRCFFTGSGGSGGEGGADVIAGLRQKVGSNGPSTTSS